MSSTRHAKAGSPLRQERFLSSVEFDQGLKAYPVARRCELLADRKERELVWWLQFKSQQEGGIEAVTAELLRRNPEALTTPGMRRFGLNPSQRYNAEQVKVVREELMVRMRRDQLDECYRWSRMFPLRGERDPLSDMLDSDAQQQGSARRAAALPLFYTAKDFHEFIREAAESKRFAEFLREVCLDPAKNLSEDSLWFFHGLRPALLTLMNTEAAAQREKVVVTAIGKKVHRCLDRALKTRRLVIVNGVARIGKSFAAQTWCQQNPGKARFVEVPPSNDDIGFFRAIARGLGLGSFLNYKAAEIRERVESVLITGQLLLVLDEAHRCWPQRNPRYGFPSRIEWLMSMVNKNVPICALTTPQFFTHQHRSEGTGWASEQFTGRITHHEQLPAELSRSDLEAVARNVLPEAGDVEIAALVAYASSSDKYLAAIDSIAICARYLAEEDGRTEVRRADIQCAMREGVIPSDRSLANALQATAPKRRKPSLTLVYPSVNETSTAGQQSPSSPIGARGQLKISSAGHGREVRPAGDLVGA